MTDIRKDLLPCPFCGFQPAPQSYIPSRSGFSMHYHHQADFKCPLEGFSIIGEDGAKSWNTRHHDVDGLIAEIEKLRPINCEYELERTVADITLNQVTKVIRKHFGKE